VIDGLEAVLIGCTCISKFASVLGRNAAEGKPRKIAFQGFIERERGACALALFFVGYLIGMY